MARRTASGFLSPDDLKCIQLAQDKRQRRAAKILSSQKRKTND